MKKGYQYERELKKILEKQFFCVRIAGSGNKTPDLIVGKNNKFILIEVKKNFRKIRRDKYYHRKGDNNRDFVTHHKFGLFQAQVISTSLYLYLVHYQL